MFCKIKIFFAAALFFFAPILNAGRFSGAANWLNINPSPRASGVGLAYYGIAEGANAALFNPAAVGFIKNRELKAHYGLLLAGIRYNSLAYIEPAAGPGSASLIVRNILSGKMDKISDGKKDGCFYSSDFSVDIGYGFALGETSAGINIRNLQSKIGSKSASAYAVDAGVFSRIFQNTRAGLSIHNISTPLKYRQSEEYIRATLSGGLSQRFNLTEEAVDFTVSGGFKYLDYEEWEAGIGIEHTAFNQFTLRGGYKYRFIDNRLKFPEGITVGVGLNIYGILADYGWVPYGQMGYTHRIGLGFKFGKSGKEKSKISINTNKVIYSPQTGSLNIYLNGINFRQKGELYIDITDSYGISVKRIDLPEGKRRLIWDGTEESTKKDLDGNYSLRLFRKKDEQQQLLADKDIIIDSTPPDFNIEYSTKEFSPDGDGKNDILTMKVSGSDKNKLDSYNIKIYNSSGKIVKKYAGTSLPIDYRWEGKDDYYEQPVSEGAYSVKASAGDIAGNTRVLEKTVVKVKYPPKVITEKIEIVEEDEGLKINLKSQVLFGQGKSELKEESFESLDEVVRVLEAYEKNKVSVEGHSDSVGSDRVNKKISLKRADAVKEYILKNGIDTGRISVKGWGEEKPIASNRTRAGRMANRRVEIIILKGKIK